MECPYPVPPWSAAPRFPFLQQQEDSLEKVIKDTESLFKTREKEYQETIDQIEVRVSAAGPLPRAQEPRCRCAAGLLLAEPQGPNFYLLTRDPSVVVAVAGL